ncbi:hypothetical protein [Methylomarinum vadi]|nr:hypothetical protein [Methylomarinum vadi]
MDLELQAGEPGVKAASNNSKFGYFDVCKLLKMLDGKMRITLFLQAA